MWEVEEGYKSQSGADLWPTVVVLKPERIVNSGNLLGAAGAKRPFCP